MKDLIINHKEIIKFWDYKKNIEDINNISVGNQNSFYWVCPECNYEWKTRISHLRYGSKGCPNCNKIERHKQFIKNNNLILNNNIKLMKLWDKVKNKSLNPEELSIHSEIKVWWKCEKGHSFESSIYYMSKGGKCPFCSNKKVLEGYNDLATTYPNLISSWNYEKNGQLKPQDFTYGSGKKVWWKCTKGHEWLAKINQRTNSKSECPICNKETQVSFPEKAVFYYISKYFDNVEENYRSKEIDDREIDIYIKDKRIGIEYDGKYYHQDKKRDIEKDIICRNNGIELWHIAEKDTDEVYISDKYIYYRYNKTQDFNKAINLLLSNLLGDANYNVDVEQDRIEIYNLIQHYEKEKSLYKVAPEVSKEWNYEKNGNLSPDEIFSGSQKKVWWKCDKGHEWMADVNSRTRGNGCTYCSNRKVLAGYNDLATTNTKLAEEWDYEKNENLLPSMFTESSTKKVWWKCEKGHSYYTAINVREKGCNCPYCTNQKFMVGYNDLITTNPELLKEWNYDKNDIKPSDISSSYRKKVWWKCKNGHEWKAVIYSRISGKGCPYCSHNSVLQGFNDLATTNPELLQEWDYDKNNILPNEISANSGKKIWWKCTKGHEWEVRPADRIRYKTGCPYCSNKKVLKGYNDLVTTYPEILKIWDYVNNDISPETVGKGSGTKVWWKCDKCGYQWQSKIVTITLNKGRCPQCKKHL